MIFTIKYGDGAVILRLSQVNKRQGKQLLAYLGAPKHLYEKVPTADLEDDKILSYQTRSIRRILSRILMII